MGTYGSLFYEIYVHYRNLLLCYAYDAVLIPDSEENLQTLLPRLDKMAEKAKHGNISKQNKVPDNL